MRNPPHLKSGIMEKMDCTGSTYHLLTKSYRHDSVLNGILENSLKTDLWTVETIKVLQKLNVEFLKKYPQIVISKYTEENKHPNTSVKAHEYTGTEYLHPVPADLRGKIDVLFLKKVDKNAYTERCLALVPPELRQTVTAIDTITEKSGRLKTSVGDLKYDSTFNAGAVVVIYENCPVRSLRELHDSKTKQVIPPRCLGRVESIQGAGKDIKVIVSFYLKNVLYSVEVKMFCHVSNDPFLCNGTRLQIPLEACYGMTIAGVQGLEFNVLIIDFNGFGNGWLKHSLYTAMSRAKLHNNILVLNIPEAHSNTEDLELELLLAQFELKAKNCAKMREDREPISGSVNLARSLCRLYPTSEPFVSRAEKDLVVGSTLPEQVKIGKNPIKGKGSTAWGDGSNHFTEFDAADWEDDTFDTAFLDEAGFLEEENAFSMLRGSEVAIKSRKPIAGDDHESRTVVKPLCFSP